MRTECLVNHSNVTIIWMQFNEQIAFIVRTGPGGPTQCDYAVSTINRNTGNTCLCITFLISIFICILMNVSRMQPTNRSLDCAHTKTHTHIQLSTYAETDDKQNSSRIRSVRAPVVWLEKSHITKTRTIGSAADDADVKNCLPGID